MMTAKAELTRETPQADGRALSGLRAVVTAGASGIGLAIADHFHAEGARCVVCSATERTVSDYRDTHPGALAVVADVAAPEDVDRLFEDAAERLGGLDVLVNNAGISGPTASLEDVSLEDWRRTLAVNLDGHFLCTRRAVPMLRAAGGGTIINMSSIGGRVGYPRRSPYAASKWAIIGLTKTLSIELGPNNIRVNALLPGMVAGPRVDRVIASKAAARGIPSEEMEREILAQISLRRAVTPEDIAGIAVFLSSPAGRNISGQAIAIDGDMLSLP